MGTRLRIGVSAKRGGSLKKRIATFEQQTDDFAKAMAEDAAEGARRRIHVRTGAMRESVTVVRVGPHRYRVFVGVDYGVFEEFGTRYRPGHPAFFPAVFAAIRKKDEIRKQVFG